MLMSNKCGFFSLENDKYETELVSDDIDVDCIDKSSLRMSILMVETPQKKIQSLLSSSPSSLSLLLPSSSASSCSSGDNTNECRHEHEHEHEHGHNEIEFWSGSCSSPSMEGEINHKACLMTYPVDIATKENSNDVMNTNEYNIVKPLMVGSSSTVYIVQMKQKENNQHYAMKVISRQAGEISESLFWNEYEHLTNLNQVSGVIKMENYFYDEDYYYIVTELGSCDLYSIEPNGCDFRFIIKSLLETVAQLHERKIAHRDIKSENVIIFEDSITTEENNHMYQTKKKNSSKQYRKCKAVKMIDFGNAIHVDEESKFKWCYELTGTLNYMSPERYAPHHLWQEWSGDVWGVGVVTYELLFQQQLFAYNQEFNTLKAQITQGLWSFPTESLTEKAMYMSKFEWQLAKHFITHLLNIDPNQRPTAAYALQHPWFSTLDDNKLKTEEFCDQLCLWEKGITTYN